MKKKLNQIEPVVEPTGSGLKFQMAKIYIYNLLFQMNFYLFENIIQ